MPLVLLGALAGVGGIYLVRSVTGAVSDTVDEAETQAKGGAIGLLIGAGVGIYFASKIKK